MNAEIIQVTASVARASKARQKLNPSSKGLQRSVPRKAALLTDTQSMR